MNDINELRSPGGVIRDPPCPACNTQGEWCGPNTGDEHTELHRCGEVNCPVIDFQFNQGSQSYSNIRVRHTQMNMWDNVSVEDTLGPKYELP